MADIYEQYKLKQVINASGKMTILGVSKVSDTVLKAQKFGGQHFFEMSDLVVKTGQHLANLIGAEDAIVVNSASSGIALAIAGLIGQGSQYHVHHPYDQRFKQREIIMPKGQNIDYGAPEEMMIELGGGQLVEAGYANMCTPAHIEEMITENTAGILYVKSHHAVQKSMLSIVDALAVAHQHHLPLILDAAAEEDLRQYVDLGVDIVIFSGAKAIEGPASGFVFGNKKYISWLRMQSAGIGRAMKIGKDNILGLTAAIEFYLNHGSEKGTVMKARLMPFVEELNKVKGLNSKVVQDGAGRDIFRASVAVTKASPHDAKAITAQLKAGNPAIYTREYRANEGIIEFDIRAVDQAEMRQIVSRLKEIQA